MLGGRRTPSSCSPSHPWKQHYRQWLCHHSIPYPTPAKRQAGAMLPFSIFTPICSNNSCCALLTHSPRDNIRTSITAILSSSPSSPEWYKQHSSLPTPHLAKGHKASVLPFLFLAFSRTRFQPRTFKLHPAYHRCEKHAALLDFSHVLSWSSVFNSCIPNFRSHQQYKTGLPYSLVIII